MKRETISMALNSLDDRYISEAAAFRPEAIQETPERIVLMKKKRIISIALAAALILALGAVAYATDLFGLRAMLITNRGPASNGDPNGGYLSLTQPQDVPDKLDSAIREKIVKSTQAWAEWTKWSDENGLSKPDVYDPPEGVSFSDEEENADGTYTIRFYAYPDVPAEETASRWEQIEQGDYSSFILLDERVATKEEHDRVIKVIDAIAKGFSGYDFNYHVYTREMADKLESIAANYGLKLRHQRTLMLQNYDDQTEGFSQEEVTAKINEVCAGGGQFFRVEPTGYDKFYYFDEGTFAVSFYTTEDTTNTGTSCYLYNSPYGTLSSGFEIFGQVRDINAFTVRSHSTPDGTELTVLQDASDMFAYVYLESSFVTLHIMQLNGLTDSEIDAILDMVDFSTIG